MRRINYLGINEKRNCILTAAGLAILALISGFPILAGPPALAAEKQQPITREFRDWRATSQADSQGGTAWVKSDMLVDTYLVTSVVIGQAPGWSLSFRFPPSFLAEGKRFSVTAGDLTMSFERDKDWGIGGNGDTLILLNPDKFEESKALPLFKAMLKAKELLFTLDGPMERGAAASFSLSGFNASVLWLQERAGDVGNEPAFGEASASLDPKLAPVFQQLANEDNLVLSRLPDSIQRVRKEANDPACAPAGELPEEGNEVHWLGGDTALFSLNCAFLGGTSYKLQILASGTDFKDAHLVSFPTDKAGVSLTPPGFPTSKAIVQPTDFPPYRGQVSVTYQPDGKGQVELTWRMKLGTMALMQARRSTFKANGDAGPWTITWQAPQEDW